ncbi:MAG: T9SS type A sorting domain-containing protein [Saprospiraceae bacterium]|nr:T9SS type A sorting domain-containing protein [Saprospiraceae bacterium]
MKKFLAIALFSLAVIQPIFSQCQIPNGSFEDWVDLTDSIETELAIDLLHPVEVPLGYFPLTRLVEIALSDFITEYFGRDTLDISIFESLQRYEPGANGTSTALRMAGDSLILVSDLLQIFSCGDRSATLTGYYQFEGSAPDSLMIVGLLHNSDILQAENSIASAVFSTVGGPTEFTKFEVPFAYRSNEVPDSASILIFTYRDDSVAADTSFFVIDELKIEGGSVPVREVAERNDFLLSPNPVTHMATLIAPFWQSGTIEIYDVSGRLVQSFENVRHRQTLSLQDLSPGLHMLRANNGEDLFVQKLVKQ